MNEEHAAEDDAAVRVAEVLRASGAYCCVECGKCVAVCPMADMYPYFSYDMSPRGFLKAARTTPGIIEDGRLWCCTECNACTETCPESVSCREMVRGLKEIALKRPWEEEIHYCASCGAAFASTRIVEFLTGRLQRPQAEYLKSCPDCRMALYSRRNA